MKRNKIFLSLIIFPLIYSLKLVELNERIFPLLQELASTVFFRYQKVDLYKTCPFWNENPQCLSSNCAVEPASNHELKALNIDKVTFPKFEDNLPFFANLEYSGKDFCETDDELKGVYVNLLKNPERFTGYEGDHAAKVWNAIYTQNCFNLTNPLHEIPQCTESKAFYQIVSGMHTSISTHIAMNFFNKETKNFERNSELFWNRVGYYPERIENLHFAYILLLNAVSKASEYLLGFPMAASSNSEQDRLRKTIESITRLSKTCPKHPEKDLFVEPESKEIKEILRNYFKNVSKIMDCLACEKCRLWGKIQTRGLGTALKILFSFPQDQEYKNFDYKLSRSDIVALFNTLLRFSTSINNILSFQEERNMQQALIAREFGTRKVSAIALVGASGAMAFAKKHFGHSKSP